MMSNLDYAFRYAEMGIPVFPVKPTSKVPMNKDGCTGATLYDPQIRQWWTDHPDAGIGLHARGLLEGDACFLEFDQPPALKAWVNKLKQEMPLTRLHKSGGKGAPHYIFKHTNRSLALGNCDGKINGGEWFSFRAYHRYVIAPPSIHPDTGKPYEVMVDMEPAPIPDWLVDAIAARGFTERQFAKDMPPVGDGFDFDTFCDWLPPLGLPDGNWHPFAECPIVGRRHEGQGVRGCALFWDGEVLGFKCQAQMCPSNSDRGPGQSGISYLISFLSKEQGAYHGEIWPSKTSQEIAEDFGAEEISDDCEPSVAPSPTSAEPKVEPAKGEHLQEAAELKYPQLRFPYEAFPEGKLKEMTDKCCEGGLSPGLIVPAILTLASSLPLEGTAEGARINLFTTLLAMVGAGKDTAMDRAAEVLGLDEDSYTSYAPSGERSIGTLLGDTAGTKDNPGRVPGPSTHVIITYELEDTLNKSKGETSGVLQAMQHYYDHNRKVYADSKYRTIQTVDCRLSWLTGLPVGDVEIDESEYRRAFGENSTHGIASRMLFGFSEERFDRRKSRNWTVPPSSYTFGEKKVEFIEGVGPVPINTMDTLVSQLQRARVNGFAPGVEDQYLAWKPRCDLSGRDTYHVLKIAILSALINGRSLIEQPDWDFATAFMDWQYEIRLVFQPGRAKRVSQGEFNETVIKTFERLKSRQVTGNPKKADKSYVTTEVRDGKTLYFFDWGRIANSNKWHLTGMDVKKTIDSLVTGGCLAHKVDYEDRNGKIIDIKDESLVRLISAPKSSV